MMNKYNKLIENLYKDIRDEKLFIKHQDLIKINNLINKMNNKVVENETI